MLIAAAIGLGSNLGDSQTILADALSCLAGTSGIQVQACSRVYRTAAVGPPQPDYLNQCATLRVTLSPMDLLQTLLAIERQLGRVRRERWGPRLLDLDLLLYGQRQLASPDLYLPHPRMRERAFVLVPLAEIAPDWRDPVTQQTIATLAQAVDQTGVVPLTPALLPLKAAP
ncbi:2-amino-4-hydroxy-6-hydroxymethyldihydropteridine diphosphokinase [Trichothermofontia sp.]